MLRIVLIGLGAAIFALHASAYRGWLVDDSGISIAYAIHLANHQGLVSQPGASPVEGYSNPLWVFLLAAVSRAGALVLPFTPKLVAGVFAAAMFAILLFITDRVAVHRRLVGAAVVVACAMNPSVVIWSMSGLENALYALLVVGLAYLTVRALESRGSSRTLVACGVCAALVALTRPDGVLFALVPPAVVLAARQRNRRGLMLYAIAFGSVFGAFLASRLAVFHHLLPNTAIAKGGPSLGDTVDFFALTRRGIDKVDALLEGAFPEVLANAVFVSAAFGARFIAKRGRLTATLATLMAFAGVALSDFMLMPADWMSENRFGTPFFPLYYAAVFVVLDLVLASALSLRSSVAFSGVAAALLCASVPAFAGRALAFVHNSNIDLFFVRRAFAERLDRYAAELQLKDASVLLPDVGGMLLWSHLRVYDLAGLCDASIAASMAAGDSEGERQYVLGAMRPTFIHTYGKWSRIAALERDPRFYADYAVVHAYGEDEDPDGVGHASGIFVRRDAVASAGGAAALESMRHEPHRRQGFLPGSEPSWFLGWLERTPLVPEQYRTSEGLERGRGSFRR